MAKKGLTQALQQVRCVAGDRWYCSDEMRFGLWGQVRRRWGHRGVKLRQRQQIRFVWRYLVLAVDPIHLDLKWSWGQRLNQAELCPIFEQWRLPTVVWDGATSHRGKQMRQLPMHQIALPAYSPELNPAERIFEEIRRAVEGEVYPSLAAKQARIDQFLRRLRADKERLRSLVSWEWLRAADAQLPNTYT